MAAKVTKSANGGKVNFGTKKTGVYSKKQSTNKRSKHYHKKYRGQGR